MIGLSDYWKQIMNYGAIVGIPLALLSYCGLTGQLAFLDSITIPYFIIALFISTRNFRNKYFNGFMSYGKALNTGTKISMFASIIVGFVVYLIYTIQPELKEQTFKLIEDSLLKSGIKEASVESLSTMMRQNTSPAQFALSTIFSLTLYGFIFMLILSFFIKKEGDSFHTAMKNIQEPNNP